MEQKGTVKRRFLFFIFLCFLSQKQELENKLNISSVNIGTFDPASDNPAGQKSIELAIITCDMHSRLADLYANSKISNSVQYAFAWLPYSDLYIDDYFDETMLWFGSGLPNILDGSYLFEYCRNLKELPFNPVMNKIIARCNKLLEAFGNNVSLETIGEYDISKVENLCNFVVNCRRLKHVHLKNIPVSLDISSSTQFEEADLVEIIGNLMDLTGKPSRTLTMGATNLAKLTDAEKAVAVNKNWVLA